MMADIHPSNTQHLASMGTKILNFAYFFAFKFRRDTSQSYEGMSSVHWAPTWAVIELVCVITSFYVEGKYGFFFFF